MAETTGLFVQLLDDHVEDIGIICGSRCAGYLIAFDAKNMTGTFLMTVSLDVRGEGAPSAGAGDDAVVVIVNVAYLETGFA